MLFLNKKTLFVSFFCFFVGLSAFGVKSSDVLLNAIKKSVEDKESANDEKRVVMVIKQDLMDCDTPEACKEIFTQILKDINVELQISNANVGGANRQDRGNSNSNSNSQSQNPIHHQHHLLQQHQNYLHLQHLRPYYQHILNKNEIIKKPFRWG